MGDKEKKDKRNSTDIPYESGVSGKTQQAKEQVCPQEIKIENI